MELGWDPPPITLTVISGGTFTAVLVASEDWPAGDAIDLRITGADTAIVWAATIDGERAEINRTAAQVAALVASVNRSVDLRYTPSGGEPAIWFRGQVRVV